MNLQDAVIAARCRKGKAHGNTAHGAFWNVFDPICILSYGGDGIANNEANEEMYLRLRHFRDGSLIASVHHSSWTQNYGTESEVKVIPDLNTASTIEEVETILLATHFTTQDMVPFKGLVDLPIPVYQANSYWQDQLVAELTKLGLPETVASPDEDVA